MDVDAKTADARFAFEERNGNMALRVFDCRSKVVDLWLEDKTLFRNLKVIDLVVLARIEDPVAVCCEVLAEMYVIAVGAEATAIVGFDHNFPFLHRAKYFGVCENHFFTDTDRRPSGKGIFRYEEEGKCVAARPGPVHDSASMSFNSPIIAIDGPAASGKSTVAKRIAKELGITFVSSGAMYRAFTWWVLDKEVEPSDKTAVVELLEATQFQCAEENSAGTIAIDGQKVTPAQISEEEVNQNVSLVAAIPEVRTRLVAEQRRYAYESGVVMEGRDIGSVVFPDTPWKFYIDASPEVREQRRRAQGIVDSIAKRDRIDSSRKASPLVIPEGAIVVDSSDLTAEEVVDRILAEIRSGS